MCYLTEKALALSSRAVEMAQRLPHKPQVVLLVERETHIERARARERERERREREEKRD